MNESPYQKLARRLDTLPNGYPPTPDGAELQLLEHIFSPQEAELASQLRLTLETVDEIAARIGAEASAIRPLLKAMSRKGLIRAGRAESGGLGFGLLPFVVGIYENQIGCIDEELARLFEAYYQQAFVKMVTVEPAFHRVVPVNQTVRNDMTIAPFEDVTALIENAQAWGVQDCICRVQKKLIGEPCDHPVDVCMVFYHKPGVFNEHPYIHPLTKEEAYATLQRAAEAGLVHTLSNSQDGHSYICNCCTCSCGILRGIAEMGISNVVARSPFVNTVDPEMCAGCEICVDYCQFDALSLRPEDVYIQIDSVRCVGCGVCVPHCPEEALSLVRRPEDEIPPIPKTHEDWLRERAVFRGIDLSEIL